MDAEQAVGKYYTAGGLQSKEGGYIMINQNETELVKLLSLTWHGEKRMIDHCLKSSKYVKIADTYIHVCDAKPSINTTIWYDDERTDPGNGYTSFMAYNKHNMPNEYQAQHHGNALRIIPQYSGDKTGGRLCGLTQDEWNNRNQNGMEVTPEMLKIINQAVREVQEDYKKRLETYWRKYSKNVHSEGYWANR